MREISDQKEMRRIFRVSLLLERDAYSERATSIASRSDGVADYYDPTDAWEIDDFRTKIQITKFALDDIYGAHATGVEPRWMARNWSPLRILTATSSFSYFVPSMCSRR